MKDETGGVAIEKYISLKPKMYSFLVDNNKHKKAEGVNKNVVATISRCKHKFEQKIEQLNKKCLKHSMNTIQRKDHGI